VYVYVTFSNPVLQLQDSYKRLLLLNQRSSDVHTNVKLALVTNGNALVSPAAVGHRLPDACRSS